MDTMGAFLKEATRWREMPSIDSRETHLPFLADLIASHIEFIRSGIIKQNMDDSPRRLEILNMFEEEARDRRESGRVSYRWWVNFNYRLSVLISVQKSDTGLGLYHEEDWISNSGLEEYYPKRNHKDNVADRSRVHFNPYYLDWFPKLILSPIKNGNLGYFTFNRFHTTRIYPLGLVNERTPVDGNFMSPKKFFEHDEFHVLPSDGTIKILERENILEGRVIPFHRAFLQKMETLSFQERKVAEWIYFLLFHEFSFMFWENRKQISTQEALQKKFPRMKRKHINIFMDVVHEIERGLGW